jgi:DNA-binding NarL/FixJ family response regulator
MGQAMSFEQAIAYALAVTAVAERTGGGNNTEAAETVRDVHAARLTPRERDVAALVARGMTNRQIAADLVLSLRTVDTHVHHILEKLGLASRAQIAVWVTEQGLTGVL